MKDFLELFSKIEKSSSSSESADDMSSLEKEECTLPMEHIVHHLNEYKERGNKNDLEFLNTFSFNENYLKELNGHINELVMTLYKNKDYDKLAYLLDEYHREDNFLEGAVLCDLILSSFKDDDLTMLKTLLMADYANNWNDLHIQKAWEIVIDNVTSNKTSILSSLKRKEERNIISDILY